VRVQAERQGADTRRMDKRVLWLCLLAGSTVGGFVPEAWGASAFGVSSLLLSAAGAVAGVWVAARISESL
jgi:outer membrane lipoprotein SlyB